MRGLLENPSNKLKNMKKRAKNKGYTFTDNEKFNAPNGFTSGELHQQLLSPCFTDEQLDSLRAYAINQAAAPHGAEKEGRQGAEYLIVNIQNEGEFDWVYDRLWLIATEINKKYRFDIKKVFEPVQIAIYDESTQGHNEWHLDIELHNMERKICLFVPLSDESEHEGGDLDLLYSVRLYRPPLNKGSVIVYPSFMLNRITPVSKGTRYCLLAWICGPSFK